MGVSGTEIRYFHEVNLGSEIDLNVPASVGSKNTRANLLPKIM